MTFLDHLRPAWHRHAACRGMGADPGTPNPFFPAKGHSNTPAKTICADCPVARTCHDTAAGDPTLVGVWGGTHWTASSKRRAA